MKKKYRVPFYEMWRPFGIRRKALESYLRGKRIAVVGNAPTEVGKRRGEEIDAADVVVRFNRFSVAPEHREDYGTRIDIWVTALCKDISFHPDISPWICCPLPLASRKWLRRYTSTDQCALVKAVRSGCVFPTRQGFEMLIREVSNPSTGLSFLHWITECMGEPICYNLYGFSFFDPKQAHHYFDENNGCSHDGSEERKYFEQVLQRC